jgi:hypothetical protein
LPLPKNKDHKLKKDPRENTRKNNNVDRVHGSYSYYLWEDVFLYICKYHMLIPAILAIFLEKGPISYTNKGEEINFNLRVIVMDVSYFSSQL